MQPPTSNSPLTSFLSHPTSNKRLILSKEGLSFRSPTLYERFLAFFGKGRASFSSVVSYLTRHLDLFKNEEEMVQFLILLAQHNAKKPLFDQIHSDFLTYFKPYRALFQAVDEQNCTLLTLLARASIDINSSDKNAQTALHHAALLGETKMALQLIELGCDVRSTDYFGQTPLHIAASLGNKELVLLFINKGSPINLRDAKGKTPLMLSIEEKHLEIASYLVQAGSDLFIHDLLWKTPLHYACEKELLPIVSLLLKCGSDIQAKDEFGETPLHIACEKNNPKLLEILISTKKDINLLLSNKQGKTALDVIYDKGLNRVVQQTLQTIKKPEEESSQLKAKKIEVHPLQDACRLGNKELLKELLHQGADINQQDKFGETVLHTALLNQDSDSIKLLIDRGANVNVRDRFGTPLLHLAYSKDYIRGIHLLMAKGSGANLNLQDGLGRTLLHLATEKGDDEIEQAALLAGANPNSTDLTGRTPLLIACEKGDLSSVQLLLLHGADPTLPSPFGRSLLEIVTSSQNAPLIALIQKALK